MTEASAWKWYLNQQSVFCHDFRKSVTGINISLSRMYEKSHQTVLPELHTHVAVPLLLTVESAKCIWPCRKKRKYNFWSHNIQKALLVLLAHCTWNRAFWGSFLLANNIFVWDLCYLFTFYAFPSSLQLVLSSCILVVSFWGCTHEVSGVHSKFELGQYTKWN